MRLAVLYDIHGNLPALEAVLDAARSDGAEGYLVGGDIAMLGPDPSACVDAVRALGAALVQGNTDHSIAAGRTEQPAVAWAIEELGEDRVAWLASLPSGQTLDDSRVLAVHASPRGDEDGIDETASEAELAALLEEHLPDSVELLLVGHTHIQYEREIRRFRLVNPGSVGFPFDGDGRAAWALLEDGEVELRRTAYDVGETLRRIAGSSQPASVRELATRRLATARS